MEERRRELLTSALDRAANGGIFLNAQGKAAPGIYQSGSGSALSAINALTLALHSDQGGYRTSQYVPFSDAKKRGDGVQAGEKGVPFMWYVWNEFRDRSDKEKTISRKEYEALSSEQKKGYYPVPDRQVRTLFNIEQTTLPLSDRDAFEKALKEYGPASERGESAQDDKKLRMAVNDFLKSVSENLAPIRRDGTGIAHYDVGKDVIHLPSQQHYDSYAEYVQAAVRQVVTATGHPERLGRLGVVSGGPAVSEAWDAKERLVVELTSAVKRNQFGLPARIANENLPLIDKWKESIEKEPHFMDTMESFIGSALYVMDKAARGEKVEKREAPVRQEAPSDRVSAQINLIQDDNGQWAMFIKPESEKGFAVYPDKGDVGRFFAASKMEEASSVKIKGQLAQKYYDLVANDPGLKVDLFSTKEKDVDLSLIGKVNVVRTKDSKILCSPVIDGVGKPEPREVSPAQWQRLFLAEDKEEYKRNLAATLFADVLRRQQEEQKRMSSPEEKAKEERDEKAREALSRAETGVVAGIIAGAVSKPEEQQEEEHSRGFHR